DALPPDVAAQGPLVSVPVPRNTLGKPRHIVLQGWLSFRARFTGALGALNVRHAEPAHRHRIKTRAAPSAVTGSTGLPRQLAHPAHPGQGRVGWQRGRTGLKRKPSKKR